MDIQKQIEFEKFHARECNCDYDELKRRLDHQVPFDQPLAGKGRRYDAGVKVVTVAAHVNGGAVESGSNQLPDLVRSHHGGLASQFVTGMQNLEHDGGHQHEGCGHHRKTEPRISVRYAEKAVAEAVDHIEHRIKVAYRVPER